MWTWLDICVGPTIMQAVESEEAASNSSKGAGPLQRFVEDLLSTNRGQTAGARAAAALRVADKTVQLDNPLKAGGANTQAGLVRCAHTVGFNTGMDQTCM